MINKYNTGLDTVKVCKKDLCVEARGDNAEAIVTALSVMLLFIGVGALISALK